MQELDGKVLMLVQLGNSQYFASKKKSYFKVVLKDDRFVLVNTTMRGETKMISETPVHHKVPKDLTRRSFNSVFNSKTFNKAILKALLDVNPYGNAFNDKTIVHVIKTDVRVTTDVMLDAYTGGVVGDAAAITDVYWSADDCENVFVMIKGDPSEFVIRREIDIDLGNNLWSKLNV